MRRGRGKRRREREGVSRRGEKREGWAWGEGKARESNGGGEEQCRESDYRKWRNMEYSAKGAEGTYCWVVSLVMCFVYYLINV